MPKKGQLQIKGKLTGRQKAQRKYNSQPEQRKRRAERNATRRKLEKAGKVHKGDGRDIDHKDHDTSNMASSNLAVMRASLNRKDGGPSARMKDSSGKKMKNKRRKK